MTQSMGVSERAQKERALEKKWDAISSLQGMGKVDWRARLHLLVGLALLSGRWGDVGLNGWAKFSTCAALQTGRRAVRMLAAAVL